MLIKLFNLVKMTWMLTWRMLLAGVFLFNGRYNDETPLVALLISVIMIFGFNKTLVMFPLVQLFGKRPVLVPADGSGSTKVRTPAAPKQPGDDTSPEKQGYSERTSTKGRITGFEPEALETIPVPNFPTMTGVPGAGLHDATGMTQTNISLGVQGEENFAKALSKVRLIGNFATVWSVPVPDQESFKPGPYGTDIDCVLATANTIYLVDLKNYKSGDVRYYAKGNELFCEDNGTGNQVGETKTMSRNMEMATNAMKYHFPQAKIIPVVVFMPTNNGEATLDNVFWPGRIRAVNLAQFLAELSFEEKFEWNMPHAGAMSRIGHLLARANKDKKNK